MDDFCLLLFCLRAFGFSHEEFVGNVNNLVCSVLVEEDDIVDVRTVLHVFVLLHARADEAFLAVDVEFLIGFDNLGGSNRIEILYLGQAWMILAIFLLDEAEPVAGHLHHVGEFLVDLLDFVFDAGYVFLGLILVELQDACHLDVHEAQDVVLCHLTHHLRVPRCQSFVNPFAGRVHRLGILKLLVLVDAFLDEDLFQCGEVQSLQEFTLANESLLLQ